MPESPFGTLVRRQALLIAASSAPAAPAQADDLAVTKGPAEDLSVSGLAGGAWRVGGDALRASSANDAAVQIDTANSAALHLRLAGKPAGRAAGTLDLVFRRIGNKRMVATQLRVPGVARLYPIYVPLARWPTKPTRNTPDYRILMF